MLGLYVDEKKAITDNSCFVDRAFWGMALLLVSTSQETIHAEYIMMQNPGGLDCFLVRELSLRHDHEVLATS